MVRLYLIKVTELDPDHPKWKKHISENRARKMEKLLPKRERALSLGAELLLNHGLRELHPGIKGPVSWAEGKYGKPYLPGYPDLEFNLSHSREYAVCAFSDQPVGVDIEYCADIDLAVAGYFLRREYDYIMSKPEGQRLGSFYDLWVLKESYLKATGFGFNQALDSFCMHMGEIITVEQEGQIQPYSFFLARYEGYRLAVCSRDPAGVKGHAPILRRVWARF